jgi:hydrogenase/urease accessory protein HupE
MLSADFQEWLKQGFFHIITTEALDHILFIIALCLHYSYREWKKIVLLVTAFTVGHSITLLLTGLGYINLPLHWVEFFIPVTIALTALTGLLRPPTRSQGWFIYIIAGVFGLVHGVAYGANSVGSLYSGTEALMNVLAFNLGVEGGQLVIVAAYMLLSFIFVHLLQLPQRRLQQSGSAAILAVALFWSYQNFPAF